ncbi:MAG: hypothetical protein ACYTCU_04030 [Planctomycetota bacterium]|jgi:hypothetical protein
MASHAGRWHLLTLAALALAVTGMWATFGGPFERGWLGHNGARYAQIARNYERHGLLHQRAAPLRNAGTADAERPDVYAHHPPALAMTVAVAFRWLGESEDSARLVSALATLLMLLLFARLVHLVAGAAVAGLATLAAASQAMVSVYGAHVDVQGPPVLCLSVAVVLAYRGWRAGGALWPVLLLSALASSYDWFGLYAPVGCGLHLWFTDRARRRAALGLAAWTFGLFAAWFAWLVTLPGMSVERLRGAAGVRGPDALRASGDQLLSGVRTWLADTGELMPGWPALLLLALVVLLGALRPASATRDERSGPPPLGARGLLALLLLPPLVHGLLFPAGMLQHGYWLFGLPLGLALGFALAVGRLKPAIALVAVAVLVLAGWSGRDAVLADRDELAVRIGETLAGVTSPGDVILTNYDTNPPALGAAEGADAYILMRPEVTFYSDRVVRGIGLKERLGREDLDAALLRRPDATWFLEVPWPRPAGEELLSALAARAGAAPVMLSETPPVRLHRIRP